MILYWDELLRYYGPEVDVYYNNFLTAGRATFALLCARFDPDDYQLQPSDGDHAEARLLQTSVWTADLPAALAAWTEFSTGLVITMAINRSPCQNCSALLIAALESVYRRFPVAAERTRFVLASRGAYEDADMQVATTQNDLIRLRDAGWELCVLRAGPRMPFRGNLLLEGIQRVAGHGNVLLD